MSQNKKIQFATWWEENILEEYRNEKYNYFLNDKWFNSLPTSLKEIILKVDKFEFDDINYEYYLEDLESEIKDYIF